jgi:small subunit ribosomal protein S21
MIIVKLDKHTNIEKALKILKSKVIRTKQTSELVNRKEYTKKSIRKRDILKKAKYIQKMKDSNN